MFLRAKNTTIASEFAFKIAFEMVGLHGAFPSSLAEAPIRRVRCGFYLSGGMALGKSLRAEFGSADLLPTFGLINCLFAEDRSSCPNWNFPRAAKL